VEQSEGALEEKRPLSFKIRLDTAPIPNLQFTPAQAFPKEHHAQIG